jgi:hypothetical protein
VIAERKFGEMLERASTNRSPDAAEVIAELVELAKQMRAEQFRGARLGPGDDELAFYDAVCQNDSAVLELGDDTSSPLALKMRQSPAPGRRSLVSKRQVRSSPRTHLHHVQRHGCTELAFHQAADRPCRCSSGGG